MIRVEFTISRTHLFMFAALLAGAVLVWPAASWASDKFSDVMPDSYWAHDDIAWLADAGITKGCNPPDNTRFCPDAPVTRAQMAAFIHRLSGSDSTTIDGRLDDLEALLAGVSRNGDVLLFDGMNLQIVNGQGSTDTSNGLGNVIIGYNEDGTEDTGVAARTGSHYLIVGADNDWTQYGGIVSGLSSISSGAYASVTGGWNGAATHAYASVTGGYSNTAFGNYSSVTGGWGNEANGNYSSVTGGTGNTASGFLSSVAGGHRNTASGERSSVTGGVQNVATGEFSSVTGGGNNVASGSASSINGGKTNLAAGTYSVVVGGDDLDCLVDTRAVCGEGVWLAID